MVLSQVWLCAAHPTQMVSVAITREHKRQNKKFMVTMTIFKSMVIHFFLIQNGICDLVIAVFIITQMSSP